MNYAILGTGRLGTALAKFLGERDEVYIWGRDEALVKRIQVDRTNEFYLPGIELPYEVRASYELDRILEDSDVLILAVPSYAYTDVLDACMDYLGGMEAVICGTTGFDPDTGRRLSQEYLERVETLENYYALCGPALPHGAANEQPGNLLLVGEDNHNRNRLAENFYRNYLRVYEDDDLAGTEVVTALNNVLAVIGGLVEGLGLDDGTRATLLTRGLHECKRLVEYSNGRRETVNRLAGLGTTLTIGTGSSSRNYRLGAGLGRGETLEEARGTISGCLESLPVSRVAHQRILKGEIKAPLLTEVYGIIHEEIDPYSSIEKIVNLKLAPGED